MTITSTLKPPTTVDREPIFLGYAQSLNAQVSTLVKTRFWLQQLPLNLK